MANPTRGENSSTLQPAPIDATGDTLSPLFRMAARLAGSLDYLFHRLFGLRVVTRERYEALCRAEQSPELAYRVRLKDAERRGDVAFLRRELERNQLDQADLERLGKMGTPLETWPDEAQDPFEPRQATT